MAQLLEWKAHVNTLAALSLKRERNAHGVKLKQQIADVLEANPDDTALLRQALEAFESLEKDVDGSLRPIEQAAKDALKERLK